jgi:RNA polymerase sigma factor (sigma-70 family)
MPHRLRFPDTSASLLSTLKIRPVDTEAWAKFVRTYGPRILQWCRRWGLQDADAHDVTQSVLLQFLRQSGTFQYDRSRRFRGWLRTVAHASWCDFVKRRRHWNQGKGGDSSTGRIDSIAARDDLSNLFETEDARESLRQTMERIQGRVEPRTWQAFWLLNMEGLSGEEAANRLGMRLGSTYAASCKVRRLIREELRCEESVSS